MNKILFILATHGNEYFSIEVFKKLEKSLPKNIYGYDWIIGNELALKKNIRFIKKDLNRSAPGDITSDIYEENRAAQLIKLANYFDLVIDIHGTISKVEIITIIPYPTIQNLVLSTIIPVKRNVIWYARSSAQSGPITQFCKQTALEIECGPMNKKRIKEKLEKTIKQILLMNQKPDFKKLIMTTKRKEYYFVYGKQKKLTKLAKTLKDFKSVQVNKEKFFPLLVNQYRDYICYKMKKINLAELFIY